MSVLGCLSFDSKPFNLPTPLLRLLGKWLKVWNMDHPHKVVLEINVTSAIKFYIVKIMKQGRCKNIILPSEKIKSKKNKSNLVYLKMFGFCFRPFLEI